METPKKPVKLPQITAPKFDSNLRLIPEQWEIDARNKAK